AAALHNADHRTARDAVLAVCTLRSELDRISALERPPVRRDPYVNDPAVSLCSARRIRNASRIDAVRGRIRPCLAALDPFFDLGHRSRRRKGTQAFLHASEFAFISRPRIHIEHLGLTHYLLVSIAGIRVAAEPFGCTAALVLCLDRTEHIRKIAR